MSVDRFCDHCGIDRELHPFEDFTPDDCKAAEGRVQFMDRFFTSVIGGPPVSDQTPTPNIVCRSCGNGHHRKYQRGEAMEPCPHCGSSALRFLVPGELSPAAAPAPTPEPPLSIADSDDPSPWADHPPTPSPVSPEDGDEPATWADLLTCERCGRPLEQPGALMFSPPNKAGMVRKHHICADCYLAGEGFTAASGAVS